MTNERYKVQYLIPIAQKNNQSLAHRISAKTNFGIGYHALDCTSENNVVSPVPDNPYSCTPKNLLRLLVVGDHKKTIYDVKLILSTMARKDHE